MNSVDKCLVAAFTSTVMLVPNMVRAMDIEDYFRMADQDRGRFAQSLLIGAEKLLQDEGRAGLAAQLDTFFTQVKTGNKLSDGMAGYEANLAAMAMTEVKREARHPNLPHLQAEKAFRDAAEGHGIPLPTAFDAIASDFHPQFPPPPPMITRRPDGTITVQKEPAKGGSEDSGAKEGLVIPPQVVVPIIPNPEQKR